jgi:glutathione peroxidase-family protein
MLPDLPLSQFRLSSIIQFGGQEPGTPEEILEFVKQYDPKMSEKLVFFEKADVNGEKTREVFAFLKEMLPDEDGTTSIRWNFSEYFVQLQKRTS